MYYQLMGSNHQTANIYNDFFFNCSNREKNWEKELEKTRIIAWWFDLMSSLLTFYSHLFTYNMEKKGRYKIHVAIRIDLYQIHRFPQLPP